MHLHHYNLNGHMVWQSDRGPEMLGKGHQQVKNGHNALSMNSWEIQRINSRSTSWNAFWMYTSITYSTFNEKKGQQWNTLNVISISDFQLVDCNLVIIGSKEKYL